MTARPKTTNLPANDDKPPVKMTFDELVAASGIDEDVLLRRMAGVLARRKETPDAE